MAKILSPDKIVSLRSVWKKGHKSTVLVGGCFDILHPGHIIFLEKAKQAGDILIILLESDAKVKQLKGINRPIHSQNERAKVLSAIRFVDYIVLLPTIKQDRFYEQLTAKIAPDIIAATEGDPNNYHKKRVAKLIGCKLVYVTKIIASYSTSRILKDRLTLL